MIRFSIISAMISGLFGATASAGTCDVDRGELGGQLLEIAEFPLQPAPHEFGAKMLLEPSFLGTSQEEITIPAGRDEWGNVVRPEQVVVRDVPSMFHPETVRVRRGASAGLDIEPSGSFALLDDTGRQVCQFETWQNYSDWHYGYLRPQP